MSSKRPLVSIIVPTFNRAKYLRSCLESCLKQSYANLEVIVVDGGSKDGSVELLSEFAAMDSRLRYISRGDKGEVYAVNDGIDMIRGEIYGIQASDDQYLPGAVEKAVDFLVSHSEFAGVGGDALFIDGSGNQLGRGMITYRKEMSKFTIRNILRERRGGFLPHGAFFGWSRIFSKIGKFDPQYFVTSDLEFYLRLLYSDERIGCIPTPSILYSIHDDMGAWKYRHLVVLQNRELQKLYGLTSLDRIYCNTIGYLHGYMANPYRTPLLERLGVAIKKIRAETADYKR